MEILIPYNYFICFSKLIFLYRNNICEEEGFFSSQKIKKGG